MLNENKHEISYVKQYESKHYQSSFHKKFAYLNVIRVRFHERLHQQHIPENLTIQHKKKSRHISFRQYGF